MLTYQVDGGLDRFRMRAGYQKDQPMTGRRDFSAPPSQPPKREES